MPFLLRLSPNRHDQEIEEETTQLLNDSQTDCELRSRPGTVKVPEVEIHLRKSDKGPIDVFKSNLVLGSCVYGLINHQHADRIIKAMSGAGDFRDWAADFLSTVND
ncbi:unnamed protein product [Microthlaspi erraticum]|uniref:Uncharacterized protein n=1 Tax=Microthlaspi erraticum TaxID=1685480 RepID=A0A6D2I3B5_9BRAS|nr:unnamed protein product [Microthlaspi erraticum]